MTFISTKTWGHDVGLSACFRQWRSIHSHCQFLHGYALSVHLKFEADDLDERNWVVDFGGLKQLKEWLVQTFDHKTVVADDDPEISWFREAHRRGVIDLVTVPAVGCERFAQLVWTVANAWLQDNDYAPRCRVVEVEVREHGANSAIYRP
jgi:6-pyruvoyltetrahydropterin/6-carboxytetrahydropterin synthase